MSRGCFEELDVWKRSKTLAVEIYELTDKNLISKDYSLRDQMRRAAVSIPSNIAEGEERYTNKESIRFLFIAKGSLGELVTQLIICYELKYIETFDFDRLNKECREIGKMIGSLIKARNKQPYPV